MTAITVSVTSDDIASGHRRSATQCPIALSLNRVLPNGVMVCPDLVRFQPSPRSQPRYVHVRLPDTARTFISQFDAGVRVQPFEFILDLEDDA